MTQKPTCIRRLVLACVMALPLSAMAQAQDTWPSKPISMIVASGAGSGVDVMARDLAQKLGAALGQTIVVDNKPGASGQVAGQLVARARPDGYTLLYSNASFIAVSPAVLAKMNHDPVKDLTPIAQTAVGGIILMVNKNVPANNLQELVALVKASPNKFSYGTWGEGTSGHLTTEWLKKKAGLAMEHVPYKTVPQVVNDLASGVLQIGWADPSTPVPMIEAKQIKGIAMSGTVRVPRTPGVPTMGEQGYPFDAVGWFGVMGPADMPPALTQRLNREINKILQSPEMAKRMETLNFEPPPNKSADEFKRIVVRDIATWKAIASDLNLKME
ncbi:MAG: tripartite tricarboxylate transporter substrate binding protein [Ramlibacter sp.]|jgi:tripartite-type tricarboxylate transporter receptor subunit TctC|uniref:Bug family tripartite tricarboxylate transporter substrate binding protein n=1 Tax=Ramlibacter sp. TaxID=1917967 RepID=UPI0026397855|nr:tripartite tricarboxylate transporter substrate binding protein [Ramlibacter sp.]MDH4374722.1 tripartite tricarboxylate transporter substrate binding protein [Ramlibacter sp.]